MTDVTTTPKRENAVYVNLDEINLLTRLINAYLGNLAAQNHLAQQNLDITRIGAIQEKQRAALLLSDKLMKTMIDLLEADTIAKGKYGEVATAFVTLRTALDAMIQLRNETDASFENVEAATNHLKDVVTQLTKIRSVTDDNVMSGVISPS